MAHQRHLAIQVAPPSQEYGLAQTSGMDSQTLYLIVFWHRT